MVGSPIKRARKERTGKRWNQKGWFETLCDEVANGETLYAICKRDDLCYGDLLHRMDGHAERDKLYKAAIQRQRKLIGDFTLHGLMSIAKADARTAYNDAGEMLEPKKIPDELALAVDSIEYTETELGGEFGGTTRKRKISLASKLQAYTKLAQYAKILTESAEVSVTLSLSDLIVQASQKKKQEDEGGAHTAEHDTKQP